MVSEPFPTDQSVIREEFRALRAKQPIGELYLAVVSNKLIQRMTYFDVRRVLQDERDVERYLGIQRPLREGRVKELKEYVRFVDATFPTSIIIAVGSDYAEYDEGRGVLTVTNTRAGDSVPDTAFRNLCRVIDGQHRIAGLADFPQDFDLLVTIFVGSDVADQAYVFATVNLEQTKVNKSLAIDLYELARSRSPIKTCHNVVVALDQTPTSPFFRRIKRLGVSSSDLGRAEETVTQATFVNSLVAYLSDEPKVDRDLILRGKKLNLVSGEAERRLPFRNMFIREQDVTIGKIVEQYFKAVQGRWPEAWNAPRGAGIILNRTNGFRALMRLFGKVYNELARPGELITAEQFDRLFAKVDVPSHYFSTENFVPGTGGEAALRNFLDRKIFGEPLLL